MSHRYILSSKYVLKTLIKCLSPYDGIFQMERTLENGGNIICDMKTKQPFGLLSTHNS